MLNNYTSLYKLLRHKYKEQKKKLKQELFYTITDMNVLKVLYRYEDDMFYVVCCRECGICEGEFSEESEGLVYDMSVYRGERVDDGCIGEKCNVNVCGGRDDRMCNERAFKESCGYLPGKLSFDKRISRENVCSECDDNNESSGRLFSKRVCSDKSSRRISRKRVCSDKNESDNMNRNKNESDNRSDDRIIDRRISVERNNENNGSDKNESSGIDNMNNNINYNSINYSINNNSIKNILINRNVRTYNRKNIAYNYIKCKNVCVSKNNLKNQINKASLKRKDLINQIKSLKRKDLKRQINKSSTIKNKSKQQIDNSNKKQIDYSNTSKNKSKQQIDNSNTKQINSNTKQIKSSLKRKNHNKSLISNNHTIKINDTVETNILEPCTDSESSTSTISEDSTEEKRYERHFNREGFNGYCSGRHLNDMCPYECFIKRRIVSNIERHFGYNNLSDDCRDREFSMLNGSSTVNGQSSVLNRSNMLNNSNMLNQYNNETTIENNSNNETTTENISYNNNNTHNDNNNNYDEFINEENVNIPNMENIQNINRERPFNTNINNTNNDKLSINIEIFNIYKNNIRKMMFNDTTENIIKYITEINNIFHTLLNNKNFSNCILYCNRHYIYKLKRYIKNNLIMIQYFKDFDVINCSKSGHRDVEEGKDLIFKEVYSLLV